MTPKSSRMCTTIKPFSPALLLVVAATLLLALAFLPQPALAATAITTCTELQNIRNDLTGDYYLANDINCSGFDYSGDGKGFMPIGNSSTKFTDTFDGKGYKITHLYINRPSTDKIGLFGYAAAGSEIKNVSLEEVDVRGKDYVGGLAGVNYGTITNSYSSGSTVGGGSRVGGLVGFNRGTIENSYSSGTVSGSSWYVGGLVGEIFYGTITNSYSSGSVSGNIEVGGLVGLNYDGTITNSYSSGSVSGSSEVGGLVGDNLGGTTTDSYWDTETSGQSTSAGGTGKTTAQMKQQATFSGWDFNTIWGIVEELTYPYLQWQFADINCTCGDICVNETGWQRDGSVFIASNTPIQHAVDNASEGDTICVEDGTYTENVDVTKRLTIRSENGSDSTTVQAQSASDNVFDVTVDYVNVSGFTMTGATGSGKAGIYLSSGVDNCNISDNSVSNNYDGIYLNNADNNNVSCNWVHNNNQRGFYLYNGSTGNTIGNNNIMSNGVSANDSWHYNFYNDQGDDVTATNNYWGTDNTTIIAESIYDKSEEGSKGTVTYDPFKDSAAPCAPIPEAATIVLFSIGLVVLVGYVWTRKNKL